MVKPFVLVVLLMGLAVGCSGNSNKADATPVASAAAPAATPDPLALNPAEMAILLALKGKNWARSEHVGKEDGKRSILFSIYAIDYVKSDEHEVPPSITVVCQGKAPWPSIDAGDLKDGNVRLRFDGGPVLRQTWKRYPHSWLGSSADEQAMLDGFATAKSLKFEFRPLSRAPQTVTFNMADYRESVLTDPMCKK